MLDGTGCYYYRRLLARLISPLHLLYWSSLPLIVIFELRSKTEDVIVSLYLIWLISRRTWVAALSPRI